MANGGNLGCEKHAPIEKLNYVAREFNTLNKGIW